MAEKSQKNLLIILALIILAGVVAYYVLTASDKPTTGEKASGAIEELSNGVDKSESGTQGSTPSKEAGDAVEGTGDEVKE